MIDTSPWKTDDPEWVKKREELWPRYENWFNRVGRIPDALPDKHMYRAKDYYFSGKLQGDYNDLVKSLSRDALLAFHPDITEESVREIFDYLISIGRKGLTGGVNMFWSAQPIHNLIEAGMVPGDVTYVIPHAFLGDSYEEAAEILDFDPNVATIDGTYKIVGDLASYIFGNKSAVYYPAKMLIPHAVRMLELCGSDLLHQQGFTLRKMIKYLNKFDMRNPEVGDQVKEFVPLFRQAIKNSNITPEIKDAIEDK